MDFISGLPRAQGLDTILVVVDRLSKYAHFIGLSHPYTAKEVAGLFVKEVVRLHGFPKSIVSDRDRLFMSAFWSEMFKQAVTKLKYSSAYHPQTDGQTEVVNKCLETYLRCFSGIKPKQWPRWLCWAEYWFNSNYNASTQVTPFKALYGRDPPTLLRSEPGVSAVEEINLLLKERDLILDELKWQLTQAQNRMKVQADKKGIDLEFEIGDMVYLRIQPYKLKSLANRMNQKLSPRFYGPFEILEKVGAVAYKLKLPPQSLVHPIFHISLLKKCVGPNVVPQPLPAELTEEWELRMQPDKVLATRKNHAGELEVLIQWHNMPECDSSWESAADIKLSFPSFHLEDKVVVQGGGIVRNQVPEGIKVYKRKKYRGISGTLAQNQNSDSGRGYQPN